MQKYAILLFILFGIFSLTHGADWPQWRGINRDGISSETGLLQSWPQEGPSLLWSFEGLGNGFSSVSIVDGMIYTTGAREDKEVLFALNLDGVLQWSRIYGDRWTGSFPDVRTTPTIHEGCAYVISGSGQVACFDAKSGTEKWNVDVFKMYDGVYHRWGIAESPLIDRDRIYVTPGGKKATMVALNKNTGKVIWASSSTDEMASYCSPILIQRGKTRLVVTMLEKSIAGFDAFSGKILWQDAYDQYQDEPVDIRVNTPVYHNGCIYITSGYNSGGALLELSKDGTKITRKWIDKTLDTHIGGIVLVNGYIYGANWLSNAKGNWVCLEWTSGQVVYETPWICKGSIIFADGMLYCYEERKGTLALVKATPENFVPISTFNIPSGTGQQWAHPAISDGRLYIRHGNALMAFDIKQR